MWLCLFQFSVYSIGLACVKGASGGGIRPVNKKRNSLSTVSLVREAWRSRKLRIVRLAVSGKAYSLRCSSAFPPQTLRWFAAGTLR